MVHWPPLMMGFQLALAVAVARDSFVPSSYPSVLLGPQLPEPGCPYLNNILCGVMMIRND